MLENYFELKHKYVQFLIDLHVLNEKKNSYKWNGILYNTNYKCFFQQ